MVYVVHIYFYACPLRGPKRPFWGDKVHICFFFCWHPFQALDWGLFFLSIGIGCAASIFSSISKKETIAISSLMSAHRAIDRHLSRTGKRKKKIRSSRKRRVMGSACWGGDHNIEKRGCCDLPLRSFPLIPIAFTRVFSFSFSFSLSLLLLVDGLFFYSFLFILMITVTTRRWWLRRSSPVFPVYAIWVFAFDVCMHMDHTIQMQTGFINESRILRF